MPADAALLTLTNPRLRVEVSTLGAELRSVKSTDGADWLWHGDAAHWAGRAPLLFPVVGRSPNDEVTVDGKPYPMSGHGFARVSTFDIVTAEAEACRLRLRASAATRMHYPFEFELDIDVHLGADTVRIEATIGNRGGVPMPASFGFHPALRWPLPGCGAGELHVCRLEGNAEPTRQRINTGNGLMQPGREASPFVQGLLALQPSLFEHGALVFPEGAGATVHYGVPGKPGVRVHGEGTPQLGLWTRPGAPFLCIEPWLGLPPDDGASGALEARPGSVLVAPGGEHRVALSLSFGVPIAQGAAP